MGREVVETARHKPYIQTDTTKTDMDHINYQLSMFIYCVTGQELKLQLYRQSGIQLLNTHTPQSDAYWSVEKPHGFEKGDC